MPAAQMKAKALLIFFSLLAGLLICELTVRVFNLAPCLADYRKACRFVDNPRIVYEYIPGIKLDGGKINRQGFRGEDFKKPKPGGLVRIAMLGDSITQGTYVLPGENFSDRLEASLNRRAASRGLPLRYEVMNFGVGGYNLEAETETLRTKALGYSPDIVVLNMFYNDDEPLPGLSLFFQPGELKEKELLDIVRRYGSRPRSRLENSAVTLLNRSRLYVFLKFKASRLKNDLSIVSLLKQRNARSQSWGAGIVYRNFLEIHRMMEQEGFDFLICIHPALTYRVNGEEPNDRRFERIARFFNFQYFNMVEYYDKEVSSMEKVMIRNVPGDVCHPNASGHELIAEAMLRELQKRGFINREL